MSLPIVAGLAAALLAAGACASQDGRRAAPVEAFDAVVAEPAPYSVFREPPLPAFRDETRAAGQRKWWQESGSYAQSPPPPRVYDLEEDDDSYLVPTHYDYGGGRSSYGYPSAQGEPTGRSCGSGGSRCGSELDSGCW